MSQFIQIHLLTSYPPSNLNRDDLGRPKTAVVGGRTRLRISSQSLKRGWRISDLFQQNLNGNVGTRTKEMGKDVFRKLTEKGVKESQARKWAQSIAGVFGKSKGKSKEDPSQELEIEQLAHFSPDEIQAIDRLIDKLSSESRDPEKEDLALLRKHHKAADIALFGRMLADEPTYNTEAAAQVAHAFSVHPVAVEDDYFTAVDDLNKEDSGAGHIGYREFGAGLFYLYLCVNKTLLDQNLEDAALSAKALRALVECAAKVSPTGYQNSFASRAYASFLLVEKGGQQPRSLAVAFLDPPEGSGINNATTLEKAVKRLLDNRNNLDKVYGPCWDDCKIMNAGTGEGALNQILDFVGQ